MDEQFINPNWHVILVHFPIGLLSAGLVIEILTLAFKPPGLRVAGRWMILIGALLSVPTALAGIYAFRDVVTSGPIDLHRHWYELVAASGWDSQQWYFIDRHTWLNSGGVLIAATVAVIWVAISDEWRRTLYWPLLVLLVASVGLMSAGAWHGGEMVYKHHIAVRAAQPDSVSRAHEHSPDDHGASSHQHRRDASIETSTGIKRYMPPLQTHIVLAGFAVASALGGLALTLRRCRRSLDTSEKSDAEEPSGAVFWWLSIIIALGAAMTGAWSVMGSITLEAFLESSKELFHPEHRRMLWHVVFGLAIIGLPFVPALFARSVADKRNLVGASIVLFLLAVAVQVWLGVHMLFDSHSGPLTHFNKHPAAHAEEAPGHSHDHEH